MDISALTEKEKNIELNEKLPNQTTISNPESAEN